MTNEKLLTIYEVTKDIEIALRGMDTETITRIYNEVCPNRIKYLENSLWIKE